MIKKYQLEYYFLAVTTIEDRLSVDVEIDLCYCDKDECNADRPSHAEILTFDVALYLCTFVVILQTSYTKLIDFRYQTAEFVEMVVYEQKYFQYICMYILEGINKSCIQLLSHRVIYIYIYIYIFFYQRVCASSRTSKRRLRKLEYNFQII